MAGRPANPIPGELPRPPKRQHIRGRIKADILPESPEGILILEEPSDPGVWADVGSEESVGVALPFTEPLLKDKKAIAFLFGSRYYIGLVECS